MVTLEQLNKIGIGKLPGHLGIVITHVGESGLSAELAVREEHMAPNGYLHAGTVVALADTCAGYGCIANLPQGASGFTTIELKSNHLGTAKEGTIVGSASTGPLGTPTQVWDTMCTHRDPAR